MKETFFVTCGYGGHLYHFYIISHAPSPPTNYENQLSFPLPQGRGDSGGYFLGKYKKSLWPLWPCVRIKIILCVFVASCEKEIIFCDSVALCERIKMNSKGVYFLGNQ